MAVDPAGGDRGGFQVDDLIAGGRCGVTRLHGGDAVAIDHDGHFLFRRGGHAVNQRAGVNERVGGSGGDEGGKRQRSQEE